MIVPITAGSSAAAVNLRGTPADASFGLMTTVAEPPPRPVPQQCRGDTQQHHGPGQQVQRRGVVHVVGAEQEGVHAMVMVASTRPSWSTPNSAANRAAATTTAPPAGAGMIRIAVGLRPGSSATRVSSSVSGGWST
jgi:hypothetical protein